MTSTHRCCTGLGLHYREQVVSGFVAFMPTIFQLQYNTTATEAAVLTGGMVVIGAGTVALSAGACLSSMRCSTLDTLTHKHDALTHSYGDTGGRLDPEAPPHDHIAAVDDDGHRECAVCHGHVLPARLL